MKKIFMAFVLLLLICGQALAVPPIPVAPGLQNPANVAITGGTITGTGVSIPMVSATDGLALTAAQASGTSLNNYGQAAAITVTLPAAAEGLNLLVIVGTQYNGIFKIQRTGSDTIIADGVAGKTYVTETNQAVGSEIAIRAFKTGASAWTWKATTVSGTWTTD